MSVLKIAVIVFLVFVLLYFIVIFSYQYRKSKSVLSALKHATILLIPLMIILFLVEISFRVIVSNELLHYDKKLLSHYSAIAYYIKHKQYPIPNKRVIRLREHDPNELITYQPHTPYFKNCETRYLNDTTYTIRTDVDGFILPEYGNADSIIFFVGGSTTECQYVFENNRFPYLVGVALNKAAISYRVKNSGVIGNNSMHAIDIIVNKILPYNPRAIILMENINDLTTLLYEGSYYNNNVSRSVIIDDVIRTKWATGFNNKTEFSASKYKFKLADTSLILSNYRNNLKLFVGICKSRGIEPLLMTQFNRIVPEQFDSCKTLRDLISDYKIKYQGLDYINLYKKMNGVVRQIALDEHLFLIDMDSLMPKSQYYMYDIVHLNNNGSTLAAKIISDRLIQHFKQ